MPPRYAYWTILVDEQPTAFRSSMQDELQPTFKRLKAKHPSARMVWFQNGKIWNSRLEAQEAMQERGERGRAGDFRQRQRDRKEGRAGGFAAGETPRERRDSQGKLEWKPKGTFTNPASDDHERRPQRSAKPTPEWKPRGAGRAGGGKLEWKPKGAPTTKPHGLKAAGPRRAKDSTERRGREWRPGGEHRDPRQKYKDAKKAKWTRFKQTIRTRWESKQTRKKKGDE